MPTCANVSFKLNSIQNPVEMYEQDIYTIPANLAGLPAISIPSGKINDLPLGIQFIGNYLNEGNIISNPYTLAKFVVDIKQSTSFRQTLQLVGKITPNLTATVKGSYNYQKSVRDNYYPLNTTRGRNTNGEASQAYLENSKIYAETNLRYRNKWNCIPR